MWETWVRSLGWKDPLENGKATHCSILAWRIPWTIQLQRVGLSDFHFHFHFLDCRQILYHLSHRGSPTPTAPPHPQIRNEEVKSLSHVRLFMSPWTVAYQAPQSMEFSRQEYWSGLPFPSSGDLPDPGIEPGSPALQADALPSEPPGKPQARRRLNNKLLGKCELVPGPIPSHLPSTPLNPPQPPLPHSPKTSEKKSLYLFPFVPPRVGLSLEHLLSPDRLRAFPLGNVSTS